jgi:hypothetical protein
MCLGFLLILLGWSAYLSNPLAPACGAGSDAAKLWNIGVHRR